MKLRMKKNVYTSVLPLLSPLSHFFPGEKVNLEVTSSENPVNLLLVKCKKHENIEGEVFHNKFGKG